VHPEGAEPAVAVAGLPQGGRVARPVAYACAPGRPWLARRCTWRPPLVAMSGS
jgi:hypothetical protein